MKKSIFIFICIFCLLAALPLAAQQSQVFDPNWATNGNAWSTSVPAQALPCVAASGSSTVYTCTTSPATPPVAGKTYVYFRVDVTNTGSSTLNVNGSGAAEILKQGGSVALVANDLLAAQWTLLLFDGTNWQMQGLTGNAAGGMVYPAAGVPLSTGSAWGASYTVGTTGSDLCCVLSSGALPAVSAANLTGFPTLNQNTSGTAGGG